MRSFRVLPLAFLCASSAYANWTQVNSDRFINWDNGAHVWGITTKTIRNEFFIYVDTNSEATNRDIKLLLAKKCILSEVGYGYTKDYDIFMERLRVLPLRISIPHNRLEIIDIVIDTLNNFEVIEPSSLVVEIKEKIREKELQTNIDRVKRSDALNSLNSIILTGDLRLLGPSSGF